MPIDYKKYPSNWKSEIRPSILKRSEKLLYGRQIPCCEFCGVENGAIGYRDYLGIFCHSEQYLKVNSCGVGYIQHTGFLKIVLTIAHLDHDINNNENSNLAALCQKCHLNYDKEHHKKNAKESRKKKMGTLELPFS